jgi:hypothetical protein
MPGCSSFLTQESIQETFRLLLFTNYFLILINITTLAFIHNPVFYSKQTVFDVRTSHETHYVSAKAQPVNAIYSLVTTVY